MSLKPRKWDKQANFAKLETYARRAAAASPRPQLIVAPEGFLEGYLVMEVIDRQRRPEELLAIAEPLDGPYIARCAALAAELEVCLCVGFAERVGDEVYNCAALFDHHGRICGTYRKTQFAEGTHPSWSFNRIGCQLRAFDTPLGRVGIVICNDRSNPRIVRALVMDGAQLILIPTYGSRGRNQNQIVLARARENGVPIVQANVGMNLIISKGEKVAYHWGTDHISIAAVDVPLPPSPERARRAEAEYLELQGPEMERRYRKTIAKRALQP